jgi:hypothetical protein
VLALPHRHLFPHPPLLHRLQAAMAFPLPRATLLRLQRKEVGESTSPLSAQMEVVVGTEWH